jgi:hypothetical protein
MDFPFSQVTIDGGFWKNIQDRNRKITLKAVADRFTETGRFASLKCTWKD